MTSTADFLLAELDDAQCSAVTAPTGPTVIVAGAGSGKTRVLTHRIAWQLELGVPPEQFFISAFTRSAADEMAERIQILTDAEGLTVGTFHSICYRLLNNERRALGLQTLAVCKDSERTRYIRDLCGKKSKDFPQALNLDVDIAMVGGIISTWKNEMVHDDDPVIAESIEDAPASSEMYAAASVYPLYEAHLASLGKLDFDDMLLKTYDLLNENPGVVERSRQQWSAFFVDEAQDTNEVQWAILHILAPPAAQPNLTIVGDTRQCLYRFRGAHPELMDNFEKRYHGANRIDLTINYRSTPQVIHRANRLISPLEMPDQTAHRGHGPEAIVVPFDDQVDQAIEVANLVVEAKQHGYVGGDVAVLIRTNAQSAYIEKAMVAAHLPYWCKSGGFFDRMEVGDIVAYLTLAHSRKDEQALRRIINRPTRYLGAAFCDAVVQKAAASDGDLVQALKRVTHTRGKAIFPKQRESAFELSLLLESISEIGGEKISPTVAINRVIDNTNYLDWLKTNSGSEIAIDDSRLDNLSVFKEVAWDYASIGDLLSFIDEARQLQIESGESTEIVTVHRAKGREWPIVVVTNFYEGSIPHKMAILNGGIPDERRIAYVAFTRAKDILVVAVPGVSDKGETVSPSRFLSDAEMQIVDDPSDEVLNDSWWGDIFTHGH